jgi:hypothetical protein
MSGKSKERVEFCGTKEAIKNPGCRRSSKCCPTITVRGDVVKVGGQAEGYSTWTRTHLEDFILAAKAGQFDAFLTD